MNKESESKNSIGKNHIHSWKLETPNGPYSMGQCKGCPKVKKFHNSLGGLMEAKTRPTLSPKEPLPIGRINPIR